MSRFIFIIFENLKLYIKKCREHWSPGAKSTFRQCAPISNIKEGDANTKFFHMQVNTRRRENNVHGLKHLASDFTLTQWSNDEGQGTWPGLFHHSFLQKKIVGEQLRMMLSMSLTISEIFMWPTTIG
jgi:hypothetical protein